MKRDLNLIRRILEWRRDCGLPDGALWPWPIPGLADVPSETMDYHMLLIQQAGFLDPNFTITWDGHEFLDAHADAAGILRDER